MIVINSKNQGFFGTINEMVQKTIEDLTRNGLKKNDANDGFDILATKGKVLFKIDYEFGHELKKSSDAKEILISAMKGHIKSFAILRLVLGMIKKIFNFKIASIEETMEYDDNDYPFYIMEIEWTITDSGSFQKQ